MVKAVVWTHNTYVNKLGYSLLQLVIRKAVTIPGLATGNKVTQSLQDSEAAQSTLEIITTHGEIKVTNLNVRSLREVSFVRVNWTMLIKLVKMTT